MCIVMIVFSFSVLSVFIMIGYFIRDINGMIAFVRRLNTVFTYLYYISPPRTPGFHHICDDFWPVFFDCRRPSLHSLRFHEFSLQSCSYQRNHMSKSRKYMVSAMHLRTIWRGNRPDWNFMKTHAVLCIMPGWRKLFRCGNEWHTIMMSRVWTEDDE